MSLAEGRKFTAKGSNTLRGGVGTYGSRTLAGNWEEDRSGPAFDGLRPEGRTERQVRDLEATVKPLPAYGGFLLSTRRGVSTGGGGEEGGASSSLSLSGSASLAALPAAGSTASGPLLLSKVFGASAGRRGLGQSASAGALPAAAGTTGAAQAGRGGSSGNFLGLGGSTGFAAGAGSSSAALLADPETARDVGRALLSTAHVRQAPVGRRPDPAPSVPAAPGFWERMQAERQAAALGATAAASPRSGGPGAAPAHGPAHSPPLQLTRRSALLGRPSAPSHFEAIEDRFDKGNLINPDRLYPAATWASLTGREHFGAGEGAHLDRGEFHSRQHGDRTGHGDGTAALAGYRARWLRDGGAAARDLRFTTEATRALGAPAAERHRPHPARTLPGTTKGVDVLRDRGMGAFGCEGVLQLLQALPAAFNLPGLRGAVAGRLALKLSVDEGKSVWRQVEAGEGAEVAREVFARLLVPALAPARADAVAAAWALLSAIARTRSAAGGAADGGAAASSGSAGEAAGSRSRGASRGGAVAGVPAPATEGAPATGGGARRSSAGGTGVAGRAAAAAAAAPGAVTLGLLDALQDYPRHADVGARKATHGECRKRFLDGVAWVAAGEPPAAPWVAGSAGAAGEEPDAAGTQPAAAEGGAGGGDEDGEGSGSGSGDAVSKWDVTYLPPRMAALPVSEAAFTRYYTLLAAGVEDDASFVDLLLALWHLEEAVNLVAPEDMPASMRPVILRAVARARGQPAPSDVLLARAGEGRAAEAAAAAAAAEAAAAAAGMSGAAAVASHARGRTVGDILDAGVAHLLLIVTHAGGRRSLQRIPCDRFLRREDKADLLARLAAAGVADAVDARVDF